MGVPTPGTNTFPEQQLETYFYLMMKSFDESCDVGSDALAVGRQGARSGFPMNTPPPRKGGNPQISRDSKRRKSGASGEDNASQQIPSQGVQDGGTGSAHRKSASFHEEAEKSVRSGNRTVAAPGGAAGRLERQQGDEQAGRSMRGRQQVAAVRTPSGVF